MNDGPVMGMSLALADFRSKLVRIPLAILGTWYKGATKFSLTRGDFSDAVKNFRKRQADLVIDYEHASEAPQVAAGGPIPAAGWLKSVDDAPDPKGILWGQADLTDDTRALVDAKKVRYVSPFLDWTQRDKKTGEPQGLTFTSIALTNRPFLDAMPAVALSDGWQERKEKRVEKITQIALTDDRHVRVTFEGGETAVSTEAIATPKVIGLSDVKRDDKGRLDFTTLGLSDAPIAPEVFRAMETEAVLDEAVKAGKILPPQREAYAKMPLSDLRGLVASMKPQVDLSTRGTGATEGQTADGAVQVALSTKIKARIAASDGKMEYPEALRLVLAENPDLERAYKAEMRGGK
jgi:phage I-like protein